MDDAAEQAIDQSLERRRIVAIDGVEARSGGVEITADPVVSQESQGNVTASPQESAYRASTWPMGANRNSDKSRSSRWRVCARLR